ncbi:enterochelin esterase domain-containing protein [Amycolatopsis panacis]|uniref:enterochelin esterase domain-containing protein n=1 Tax=Amycolatopsis panacis TaxID=2340917 RepID=UPI00131421F6|nr:enterochelin esterase domain-containing protein [Amycolatopsis panacis]
MTSTSPRLGRFGAEFVRDPDAAVSALLADVAAARGPVIEDVAGAPDALVTFVYVDDVDQVELGTQALMLEVPRNSERMRRVAGADVWTLVLRVARDITTAYCFQVDPPTLGDTTEEMMATVSDPERHAAFVAADARSIRADPYNPRRVTDSMSDSGELRNSVLVMPDAAALPAQAEVSDRVEEHALPGGRRVDLYRPVNGGDDLPLDGEHCRQGLVLEHLDAAIAEGRVPPVWVVLWHNLSPTSRMVEMACNPVLPAALADELFPWLHARGLLPPVSQRVLAGFSYGGLATAYTVLHRPDLFGAALPISASLFFTPDPNTEQAEWLARQVRPGSTRARWFLAVRQLEDTAIGLPGVAAGTTMVSSARRFHDALRDAGADVAGLLEYPSGHGDVHRARGGRAGADRAAHASGSVGRSRRMKSR